MRLERRAGAKSCSAVRTSFQERQKPWVLAKGVTCSNLQSEEYSGSCVGDGAGVEAGGLVEGGSCTRPERWFGVLG